MSRKIVWNRKKKCDSCGICGRSGVKARTHCSRCSKHCKGKCDSRVITAQHSIEPGPSNDSLHPNQLEEGTADPTDLPQRTRSSSRRRGADVTALFEPHPGVAQQEETTLPSYSAPVCSNCKRNSTPQFNIDLNRYETGTQFRRRKYGALGPKDPQQDIWLCRCCHTYLTEERVEWKTAWPSVFYSIFFKPQYRRLAVELKHFTSQILQDMWSSFAGGLTPGEMPYFVDKTTEQNWFDSEVLTDVGGLYQSQQTVPWPDVKCCCGGETWSDKSQRIGFHHLLYRYGFRFADSDSRFLNFARPDWPPRPRDEFIWTVAAAMSIHQDFGLSFLVCNSHTKPEMFSRMLHPSKNPHYNSEVHDVPEIFAPVHVQPNIVRQGRIGAYNTSSPVIETVGGYFGMSSFTLAGNFQDIRFYEFDQHIDHQLLAVREREDIMNTAVAKFGIAGVQELLHRHPSKTSLLAKRMADATFLEQADAFHAWAIARKVIKSSENDDNSRSILQRLVINPVHHNDDYGMPPFVTCTRKILQNNRLLLTHLASVMLNCRPIHRNVLSFCSETNFKIGDIELVHLLSYISTLSKGPSPCRVSQKTALQKALWSFTGGDESNANIHQRLVQILHSLTPDIADDDLKTSGSEILSIKLEPPTAESISTRSGRLPGLVIGNMEVITAHGVLLSTYTSSKDIILCQADSINITLGKMPLRLGDNDLHLVMINCKGSLKTITRWSADFAKWRVIDHATGTHQRLENPNIESGDVLVAIYAKPGNALARNEAILSSLGGQNIASCEEHSDEPHGSTLIKVNGELAVRCCLPKNNDLRRPACGNKAYWRCRKGLDTGQMQCTVGLCSGCFKKLPNDRLTKVQFASNFLEKKSPTPDFTSQNPRPQVELPLEEDVMAALLGESDDEIDREVTSATANLPLADLPLLDEEVEVAHSRYIAQPVFSQVKGISSKYWLVNRMKLLSRKLPPFESARTSFLMQQIVSPGKCPAVSLLYPEGNLIPSVFFRSRNGSIPGALPHHAYTSAKPPEGIAPLSTHNRVRLCDGDLATSHTADPIHWMFDTSLNHKLNHKSSQMVMKYGFEHLAGSIGLESGDTGLPYDGYDSNKKTKELAAQIKLKPWSYFYTVTPNDSGSPGLERVVRCIRIACAIRPPGSKPVSKADYDLSAAKAAKLEIDGDKYRQMMDYYLPTLVRIWHRTLGYFVKFIERPNEIFGKVYTNFTRVEFQSEGAPGNKPHIHGGVSIDGETQEQILERINLDLDTFFSKKYGTDYESLLRRQLVEDYEDFLHLQTMILRFLRHSCQGERCLRPSGPDSELICRVRGHPKSTTHFYEEKNPLYTQEVYEELERLGAARKVPKPSPLEGYTWELLDESLKAGTYHYVNLHPPGDCKLIPTIPLLAVLFRSATNVQVVDRRFCFSYLIKYNAGKECRQRPLIKGSANPGEVVATIPNAQLQVNEKITGVRIHQEKKDMRSVYQNNIMEVAMTEMIWLIMGFEYTFTNVNFVHLNTQPPEYRFTLQPRSGAKRLPSGHDPQLDANSYRKVLKEQWRLFTPEQIAHIREYIDTGYGHGAVEKFNVRPPETLIIDSIEAFHRIFTYKPGKIKEPVLSGAEWPPLIDGLQRHVKFRKCSLQFAVQYLNGRNQNHPAFRFLSELLSFLLGPDVDSDHPAWKIYVENTSYVATAVVTNMARPSRATIFQYQLALVLGNVPNENAIFRTSDFKDAFLAAGMIEPSPDGTTFLGRDNVIRRYLFEHLVFCPISAKKLGTNLLAAIQCLDKLLDPVTSVCNDVPQVSIKSIQRLVDENIDKTEKERIQTLTTEAHSQLSPKMSLPPLVDMLQATREIPLHWLPELRRAPGQSDESIQEQLRALQKGLQTIDDLLLNADVSLRHLLLAGSPGVGKTLLLMALVLYARSRGLNGALTCLTGERACAMGGVHIHRMFPLRVKRSLYTHPFLDAQDCIRNIARNPAISELLYRMDILFIDEIGLVSAETYATIDLVLKYVMGNDKPMGGKLIVATGDHAQLSAISGRPFWLSTHLLFTFDTMVLQKYVRCANDPLLQRVVDTTRRSRLNAEQRQSVLDAVADNCQFFTSWDEVPADMLRLLPTKKAEREVVAKDLAIVKESKRVVTIKAVDQVQLYDNWVTSKNAAHSRKLSWKLLELETLHLYLGQVVRLTFNNTTGRPEQQFSQGQLAIVESIPDDVEQLTSRITVRLLPPGSRVTRDTNQPGHEASLARHATQSIPASRDGLLARRLQFPFCFNVTSTIHKVIGSTALQGVAVQMSDYVKHYMLWERQMFTVLVSRAPSLNLLAFVTTDIPATLRAIDACLTQDGKFDEAIEKRLAQLNIFSNQTQVVDIDAGINLPGAHSSCFVPNGVVYHLISRNNPYKSYVGQTDQPVNQRLAQHNGGRGSIFTKGDQWVIYSIVSGFHNQDSRVKFEHAIHVALVEANRRLFPWHVRILLQQRIAAETERLTIVQNGNINEDVVRRAANGNPSVFTAIRH